MNTTRSSLCAAVLLAILCACVGPPEPVADVPSTLHIDRLEWSKDPSNEGGVLLLGHIEEWPGFPALKEFTRTTDPHFSLVANGHAFDVLVGTGGVTSADGRVRFVMFHVPGSWKELPEGREFALVPRNEGSTRRWAVREGVSISSGG